MKRIFAAAVFSLAASASAFGQCGADVKQALIKWDKDLGAAAERGDRGALESAYADDYVAITPAGVAITKAQAIADAMRGFEQRRANPQEADTARFDHYDVVCTANTAVVTHRTINTPPAGQGQPFHSRTVHVLEKRGGKWVMVTTTGHPLNDQGRIIYMERDLMDEMTRGEMTSFGQFAADNYLSISPVGAVGDKKSAIDGAKNFKFDSVTADDVRVRVQGDTAVVTGRAVVKGSIVGGPARGTDISGQYRYTRVYAKDDGQWKIISAQITPIQQPQQAATTPR